MRKLHMGTMSYGVESMDEVGRQLGVAFANAKAAQSHSHGHSVSHSGKGHSHGHGLSQSLAGGGLGGVGGGAGGGGRGRRDMSSRVRDVVQSLALCHNVTPVWDDAEPSSSSGPGPGAPETENGISSRGAGVGGPLIPGTDETRDEDLGQTKMKYPKGTPTYQASSPDEVAIVSWTEEIGLSLVYRDRGKIVLRAGQPPSSSSRSRSGGLSLDGRGEPQFSIGEDDEGEEEDDTLLSSPSGRRSPRRSTTTYSYAGNTNAAGDANANGRDDPEEEDTSTYLTFDILSIFPFTSESKRMGIIIRETTKGGRGEGEIWFLLKGT